MGGAQWQMLAATYPWLNQYKDRYGYEDILLISRTGDVVYSLLRNVALGQNLMPVPSKTVRWENVSEMPAEA